MLSDGADVVVVAGSGQSEGGGAGGGDGDRVSGGAWAVCRL